MQKNAWIYSMTAMIMGAVGVLLRWLQCEIIYDAETGLPVRGAGISVLLVVALLALPALAARRFSQRLFPRMLWTALLAFVSLVAGLAIARLTGFSQPSVPVVFLAAALAIAFRKK